jgi:putative colanic acid biosynthesis acetyltransferase WcaF
VKRLLWLVVSHTIFRCLVGGQLRYVRNLILRMFGAQLPLHVMVYPNTTIHSPWNLVMKPHSCIGPHANIYNRTQVTIGESAVVSQDATLCTAGHDITDVHHALIMKPIVVADKAWVAADAFIGMGVTIGEGAVVGARAAVFKDVEPWTVVGGNPAQFIKKRVIKE